MNDGREIDHAGDEIGSRIGSDFYHRQVRDRSEIGQVGVKNKPCGELTDGSVITDLSTAKRMTNHQIL